MATKAELEILHDAYRTSAGLAAAATRSRLFGRAVDHAVESLTALPGYADFETRYLKTSAVPLPTLDTLFTYAPPLFRADALRRIEELLLDYPKLSKKLGRDLSAELATALAATDAAVLAWHRLSGMSGDSMRASPPAVKVWAQLGLIGPGAPKLGHGWTGQFEGKCVACGALQRGDKLSLLAPARCRACGVTGEFILVQVIE